MSDRLGLGVLAVVMVPVLVVGLLLWVLLFAAQPANAVCSTGTGMVEPSSIPADARVAGFGQPQLVNAALIVNAAATLGLDGEAQLLGVQTAIGESSLLDLAHGDGAINPDDTVADSLGLFQQQSSWGTVAQRLDPSTAAALFFKRLQTVTGWEQLVPTLAINAVQGNQDPDYYASFRSPAIAVITYLGSLPTAPSPSEAKAPISTTPSSPDGARAQGAVCGPLSGDTKALATALLRQVSSGRLSLLEPRYRQELADVAVGTQSTGCGLDPRTLQIIQLALKTYQTVGVSDLNRRCTGSLLGAGTRSSHWIDGGGQAVDFYAFDGTALTGGDPASLQFLHLLDPVVPPGTRAGQAECRPVTTFVHLTPFEDTCNHLHIDVAFTNDAPLTLPG